MRDDSYTNRRPLAAAADPMLVIVIPLGLVPMADAPSFIGALAAAGLPAELADEASLSRRGSELLNIDLVVPTRAALDYLIALLGAGSWAGIAVLFKRLVRRSGSGRAITVSMVFDGRSRVVGTAEGEAAAELMEGLPEIVKSMKNQ
jgi:hypothetical protein